MNFKTILVAVIAFSMTFVGCNSFLQKKGLHLDFYDLFRFENGKSIEHWDVIQEIPSEGLANENGMFGF